jgi:hypothetical protein
VRERIFDREIVVADPKRLAIAAVMGETRAMVPPLDIESLDTDSADEEARVSAEARDPSLANDPVWQAFRSAPVGPPETEEQRRSTEAARRGPFVSGAGVSAEIAARCPGK